MDSSHKLLYFTIAASAVLLQPTSPVTDRTPRKFQSPVYTSATYQSSPNYQHNNFHPAKSISRAYRHHVPEKIRHAIRRAVNDLQTLTYAVQHPKQAHWRWEK
jgi:hypothetical protein